MEVSYNGNNYSQDFQVEEYKKPELAVSVVPNKKSYTQGDSASIGITAAYYFGAPVSQAPGINGRSKLRIMHFGGIKIGDLSLEIPNLIGRAWWYYGGDSYYSGEKVTEGVGKTNAKGELTITPPIDISNTKPVNA